ncbi:MarR family winged helix-turn-helix transcriptional regulator [Novosphingobium bradum]|uniref:MarR family winged helix-turn-helix transcriptional regulator n=1 Tax=Novosphingobium bradum TaxID=1737444 RepID=A0ABV7IL04_9SPHN
MDESTPRISFHLSWAARLFRTRFDARARSLGLTRSQWTMIASISRNEGSTQSELASQLEINSVTAGRIIDRLEASGWVERRPNPMDRRAYRIYLKDEAAPILDNLSEVALDEEATALAGIDPAQQAELLRMLEQMVRNLNGADLIAAKEPAEAAEAD